MFEIGKLYTNRSHGGGFVGTPIFHKEAHEGDHILTLVNLTDDEESNLHAYQMNLLFLGTKYFRDICNAKKLFYRFLWKDKIVCLDEGDADYVCQVAS